jgi:integrase
MAAITQRGKVWQIRIKHRLLPKAYFRTFDTEAEARAHARSIEDLLDRGIVVPDLVEAEKPGLGPKLAALIDEYKRLAHPSKTDVPVLDLLAKEVGKSRFGEVTTVWVDAWLRSMKIDQHLAPSTVRKRVGSLSRVIDFQLRKSQASGQPTPVNPLKLLPAGYSNTNAAERATLQAAGKEVKKDQARDRRLSTDELERIRAALAGEKRTDRERALTRDPEFSLLFELILNSGLRLFEAYRLRVESVDIAGRFLRVDGSKGRGGAVKPRTVPIVRDLVQPLKDAVEGRRPAELLFRFWDGSEEDRPRCTNRLSHRFGGLFAYANIQDFTEHDLRHEATCRWILMKNKDGAWAFTDAQIMKIMGWTSVTMMLRYASLRGEDLARLLDD